MSLAFHVVRVLYTIQNTRQRKNDLATGYIYIYRYTSCIAVGIRAAKQAKCTTWADVLMFLEQSLHFSTNPDLEKNHDQFEVVLKPVDSAGSEDVTLCLSLDDCRQTFERIVGKVNGLGLTNTCVLAQVRQAIDLTYIYIYIYNTIPTGSSFFYIHHPHPHHDHHVAITETISYI
jgi:hypothetical protein